MRIADILDTKGRTVHSIRLVEDGRRCGRASSAARGWERCWCSTRTTRSRASSPSATSCWRSAATARAPLPLAVTEMMTQQVEPAPPTSTVAQAMAPMTAGRYRHLPVVDNGQVVGLVSIGDLVKNRVREMEMETGVLRDTVIARS